MGENRKVVKKIMSRPWIANDPSNHRRSEVASSDILDDSPNEMRLADSSCVIVERRNYEALLDRLSVNLLDFRAGDHPQSFNLCPLDLIHDLDDDSIRDGLVGS